MVAHRCVNVTYHNYTVFHFVEVFVHDIVRFFHGCSKIGIFEDVVISSAVDMLTCVEYISNV